MSDEFWVYLEQLVESSRIVIDRPRGSIHPRLPGKRYPVDYGYLDGTGSIDGGGVDIWVGSSKEKKVVGALCTVDLLKKDTELKILYDCSDEDIQAILEFINSGEMRAIYLENK